MSDPMLHLSRLVLALNLLVTLVWAIVGLASYRLHRGRQERTPRLLIVAVLSAAMTIVYFSSIVFGLVPLELRDRPPSWLVAAYLLNDCLVVLTCVLFRHMSRYLVLDEAPPSRRWLSVNYGAGLVMAALALLVRIWFPSNACAENIAFQVAFTLFMLGFMGMTLGQIASRARRDTWRPGAMGVASHPDVVALAGAVAAMVVMVWFHANGSWQSQRLPLSLTVGILGVMLALPFAVRMLGEVIAGVIVGLGLTLSLAAVAGGTVWAASVVGDPAYWRILALLFGLGLLVVVGPWGLWLRGAVDGLVFRRNRLQRSELQGFLQGLSPELGRRECAERSLRELGRVMSIRGAAIVFDDGEVVQEGRIHLDAVLRVWRRESATERIGDRRMSGYDLRELPLPLREPMIEADVVGIYPVRGSREVRGHLLLRTDLVSATFRVAEIQALEAFCSQLGVLLDSVELLARAISVERSLAHAEKLGAIGELAARVAHEIRNPLTAARSLAQILERELDAGPPAPARATPAGATAAGRARVTHPECAALIVSELGRVERQVAALLRFARREEFRLEPCDLGEIVADAVEPFRARLAEDGIGLAVDAAPGCDVRVDREKIRQAVVNLVENARDALLGREGPREIRIELAHRDGEAELRVADTGPGVDAETLPRLFDPFFSMKAEGTGLGLAIVKRTVEAHGGRVRAERPDGAGMRFAIELPTGGAAW